MSFKYETERVAGWTLMPGMVEATAQSSTPPVEISPGRYRFDVPGGSTTSHPSTGIYAVFPMRDITGRLCEGWGTSNPWGMIKLFVEVEFHTKPGASSDTYVRCGFSDNYRITATTYNGVDFEMQFTGGNELPTTGLELYNNASAFRTVHGGTPENGNSYIRGTWGCLGNSSINKPATWGMDSSRVTTDSTFYSFNVNTGAAGSAGDAYIYIAAGRLAATAGEENPECTFRFRAVQLRNPS